MSDRLVPAPAAAIRLGLTPASFRNALWKDRRGLPGRPVPQTVKVGGRVYVEAAELDRFLEAQKAGDDDGDPRAVLETIASQIENLHPEQDDRLRRLARGRSMRLLRG